MALRLPRWQVHVPESSPTPEAPNLEQLLEWLAERDAAVAERDAAVAERDRVIGELSARVAERDRVIGELSAQVAELEARLGRNSQNSSKPPSSDAFVKPPPRSLRKKSGRKPGKQPGERGARLEPVPEPDQVEVHAPVCCVSCGEGLEAAPVVGEEVRQVFDLPPVRGCPGSRGI